MIQPGAGGIDGVRIRPTCNVLCETASQVRTISYRKCVQRLLKSSWRRRSQGGVRHVAYIGGLWRHQTQPFVIEKEEGLVVSVVNTGNPHRPPKSPPKIVLPERGFSHSEEIIEPVFGIEKIIAQIVVG